MSQSQNGDELDKLADSFLARYRRGERPSPEVYAQLHPEFGDEIRELFPALAAMEDLKRSSRPDSSALPQFRMVERLGDYRIVRLIGAGGMGIVYEAERESLQSRVALKLLHPHSSDDPGFRRRFKNEARSAARLHHSNIVSVFDFGEQDGVLYYAMQYIAGSGLDRVLEEARRLRDPAPGASDSLASTIAAGLRTGRFTGDPDDEGFKKSSRHEQDGAADADTTELSKELSRISSLGGLGQTCYHREVVRIGAEVAEALAYAHSRYVLHRDIKPSNLLLDSRGTAWVTDFGLAKFDGGDNLTETGEIVGTIRYMAPERFEGRSDARCDIYALGVTLYEMLALRPAFQAANRASLIREILSESPPLLRRFNSRISYDLETVVHKAMAREPRDRYASATELAEELRRVAANQPIRARRVPALEKLGRWCRNNRVVAALSGATAAMIITVAVVATVAAVRLERSNVAVKQSLELARGAERARTEQLYEANRIEARAVLQSKQPGQRFVTLDAVKRALALGQGLGYPRERYAEIRDLALGALALPDLYVTAGFSVKEPGNVTDLDREFQLYCQTNLQGEASVHRISDGKAIATLPKGKPPRNLRFMGRGWLADHETADKGGTLRVWDFMADEPKNLLRVDEVLAWDISVDGRRVVTIDRAGVPAVFELPSGRCLSKQAPGLVRREPTVRFHPFAPYFTLCSYFTDHVFEIRHMVTGRVSRIPLPWDGNSAASGCWTDDGLTLAVSRGDGGGIALFAFDPETANVRLLRTHRSLKLGSGLVLHFNAAGDRLYALDWGRALQVIDVQSGLPVFQTSVSHPQYDHHIRLDESGRRMFPGVVDSAAGSYGIWSIAEGRESYIVTLRDLVNARADMVSISPDGRFAAVAGLDGLLVLFDPATWMELGRTRVPAPRGGGIYLAFDEKNNLYTNSFAGAFRWPIRAEPEDANQIVIGPPERLPFHPGDQALVVSRDGRTIAQAMTPGFGMDDYRGCWILRPADPIKPIWLESKVGLWHVSLSPDGRWAALICRDDIVRVYDAWAGKLVKTFPREYAGAAFSPDGKWLGVSRREPSMVSEAAMTWLCTVGTWEPEHPLGSGGLYGFSPDGRFAVLGENTGGYRLIDVDNRQQVARVAEPNQGESVEHRPVFTPDSSQLVVPHNQGIRVWDLRRIREGLKELSLDWDGPSFQKPAERPPSRARFVGTILIEPRVATTVELARGLFAPYFSSHGDSASSRLAQGRALLRLGFAALAERALDWALALDPRLADAYRERGIVRFNQARWAQAAADFGKALEAGGPEANVLFRRAWCYHELGKTDQAAADLATAVPLPSTEYPRNSALIALRAEVFAKAGQPDREREEIRSLEQSAGDPVEVLAANADKMLAAPLHLRAVSAAVALARRAFKLRPNDAEIVSTFGQALYRGGSLEEARSVLTRGVSSHRGTTEPFDLFTLAMCLAELGDQVEARQVFDRALAWGTRSRTWHEDDTRKFSRFEAEARQRLGLSP
jgi:serine/threonine protein kinase/tetratricopeptide (TPR) repeat protein/WD40 repeat protein